MARRYYWHKTYIRVISAISGGIFLCRRVVVAIILVVDYAVLGNQHNQRFFAIGPMHCVPVTPRSLRPPKRSTITELRILLCTSVHWRAAIFFGKDGETGGINAAAKTGGNAAICQLSHVANKYGRTPVRIGAGIVQIPPVNSCA